MCHPLNVLPTSFCHLKLSESKTEFTLARLGTIKRFIANSKEEARNWYNALKLRSLVILSDLTDDFVVGKVLGEGNYAKVKLGIKKETGQEFAIKSIDKQKVIQSPSNVVSNS